MGGRAAPLNVTEDGQAHLLFDLAGGEQAVNEFRALADASAMLHAGATRIGASASVKILAELAGHAPTPASGNGY